MHVSVTLKTMWRRTAIGVLSVLAATCTASAGERWTGLRSSNFELFTATDEKTGRNALVFFEEVRRAFTEILGVKLPENKPVTIIAFRDEQAFAPYRPMPNVTAFTISLPRHDYIVMQDLIPEHYPLALHEYTHAIVDQAGMKLPLWLNEGFADLYATMIPAGRKILVGRIIPGRLQTAQAGLIDLHEVLSAGRESPLYHEANRNGIFYAESWALVHMLKFSEPYSDRFDRLLDAIGRSESSEQALQTIYGKTTGQIQADLAAYVHGDHFREGVINARLEKSGTDVKPETVDPLQIGILLASIQARGPYRQNAIKALEQLADEHPGHTAPVESLAWIQLTGPDPKSAVEPFRRAIAAGTRDANLCFQLAVRLRGLISDADYVAALRRAADLDPDFSPAQQQLAAHAFNSHDYAEAVTRLHLVKKLDRAQAFKYYRALSFAALQTGNLTEAKSAAERAQQFAATPDEKRLAGEMLKFVSSSEPGDLLRLKDSPLQPQ